ARDCQLDHREPQENHLYAEAGPLPAQNESSVADSAQGRFKSEACFGRAVAFDLLQHEAARTKTCRGRIERRKAPRNKVRVEEVHALSFLRQILPRKGAFAGPVWPRNDQNARAPAHTAISPVIRRGNSRSRPVDNFLFMRASAKLC